MLASGLKDTPTTTLLLLSLPTTSLLTTLLSLKPYLGISLVPHLWPYLQLSRTFTHPIAHTSSSTLLFTCVLLYQLRVLERLYSSRKYASLLLMTAPLTAIATVATAILVKAVSGGRWNYVPAGFTAQVFVLLAQYVESTPVMWTVRVQLGDFGPTNSSNGPGNNDGDSTKAGSAEQKTDDDDSGGGLALWLSDKWTTYLLAGQLACAHLPYSLLPAAVGWVIGKAYRREVLPSGLMRWRIPRRVWTFVGGEGGAGRDREMVESLRRRLREEEARGSGQASGVDGGSGEESSTGRRR